MNFTMFAWLQKNKINKVEKVGNDEWAQLIIKFEYLQKLDIETVEKLKTLVNTVINKPFVAEAINNLKRAEVLFIVTQACVLTLNLGEEWLNEWQSILIETDKDAKFKLNNYDHFGASYLAVLSAIIDGLNGKRNGIPPMHSSLNKEQWETIFNDAMHDFKSRIASGPKNEILFDECAADSLANFFSIMSEVFFIAPDTIRCAYPDVYNQLMVFYRQNTAIQQNMNTNNTYKGMFEK